jgi:hypothetical protein
VGDDVARLHVSQHLGQRQPTIDDVDHHRHTSHFGGFAGGFDRFDRIFPNDAEPVSELYPDREINQTLGRAAATSLTIVLSILPLTPIGGEVTRGFGLAIIFGIAMAPSRRSSSPRPSCYSWLFLGETRLRPARTHAPQPTADADAR